MSGIFGKFVRQIPLGVVIALLISLFEAFFILPQHFASMMKSKKTTSVNAPKAHVFARFLASTQTFWDNKITPAYVRILDKILNRRYWVALSMGLLFFGTIVFAQKQMKFILFPPEGIEMFFVRFQAPSGTALERTTELSFPIEKWIQEIPKNELRDFTSTIGIVQNDPNDPFTKRGAEYGQIAVFLSPETERTRTAQEIIDELRQKVGLPKGLVRVSFDRAAGGPPVGKPVSLGVRAENYEDILHAVAELKKLVATIPGTIDVTDTFIPGLEEVRLQVRPSEAAAAGLSVAQIGNTVRAAYDGMVATSIQELNEQVDIRVLLPSKERAFESSLQNLLIPNMQGSLIPLGSVTKTGTGKGLSVYEHESGEREIKVTADVDVKQTSAVQANQLIREKLGALQKQFPKVRIDFGGEDADTQESLATLARSFVIAFIGILFIMILTFKRILQPVLLMLTIPMGVISVIWTFYLHGLPLSFMGMLGIIALAGVIVNNAIVFVDFVNQDRLSGISERESILNAANKRIRPIFLTTLTTVFGLMPTAYGIGGLDRFVMPIALALGWGLLVGSLMTALAFPAAIAILDDIVNLGKRLTKRTS